MTPADGRTSISSHSIGAREKAWRKVEAERLRGLQIDRELKLRRLLEFLPVLDTMMSSGLVTIEKVQVLQYGTEMTLQQ